MVKAKGIDLQSLLRFEPERGRILLKDYRMVLFSACALGALRRQLIETLGHDEARGLLKRFGHAAGLADGLALAERFPDASKREHLDFGPALHALEGVAHIVRIPEGTHLDPDAGHCRFEAWWENSYEAEQHLELFGRSDAPVCWTLVGYATGHSTSAAGRRTIVVETECRAMGHERCRFVGDYADELPEEAAREERDYEAHHLPEVLQELLDTIRKQKRRLREKAKRITSLEHELAEHRPPAGMLGESPAFQAALATARTVAPVDATVLLLGETGTGKELFARSIHDQSLRRAAPFLAVNCSALPETLQEAELFGYAKGAFTGASTATAGVFEAASGGTLFLDEIGDLSPTAQTKILRALQEGEVKRLGEARTRKVDVRIVAATHRDLRAMVQERRFREDLFYRLGVISIALPPLRERGNDALLLAEHFLAVYARKFARGAERLSCAARRAIAAHTWPGNVRELEHAIERAVILSSGAELELEDLPPELSGGVAPAPPLPPLADGDDEPARIRAALEATNGNRARAARLLGVSRTTLWRRLRELDAPG